MFKQIYLNNWQRIANSEPKPTLRYNRAAIILRSWSKEIKIREEKGFYKLIKSVIP